MFASDAESTVWKVIAGMTIGELINKGFQGKDVALLEEWVKSHKTQAGKEKE